MIIDRGCEFLVACLCAEWCDTCREYKPGFESLEKEFTGSQFLWVDIEDNASWCDDFEVTNFPTIIIQRGELVLFFGVMLPHLGHVRKMLETFMKQSSAESRAYAHDMEERRNWQTRSNVRAALSAAQLGSSPPA